MNEIIRIAAIGIMGGLLALVLRKEKPELALALSLITSVIIAAQIIAMAGTLISDINSIIAECGVDIKYFAVCIKAVGLSYVSQFAAEILRDSGEGAIASKVEAAGKISILLLTMPVIMSFLQLCLKVVHSV